MMKFGNLTHEKLIVSFRQLKNIYLLSALELIVIVVWSVCSGAGLWHPDSYSYYDAFDVLATGRPDACRTPLYPMIVGILRTVFGMRISLALVYIFQSVLFLLSIGWVGKMLEDISQNQKIAFWFTAIYGLYPGALAFCGRIMTESITVSLISALLYLVAEAYYRRSAKKAILSGAVCVLLLMLRPSLMSIPVILSVMWLCILFRKGDMRKIAIRGFSASMVSFVALGLYSIAFKMEYQIPGVSGISVWNNYVLVRQAHVYDPSAIESAEMRADVDSLIKIDGVNCENMQTLWLEREFLENKYGMVEFDKFVGGQIKANPLKICKFICIGRLDKLIDSNCVDTGDDLPAPLRVVMRIVNISNGTALLIFLVGLTLLTASDIRRKKVSYYLWLIFVMFAANYFTVWVGAPNEYKRLLAQNYPVLIAVSCWVLSQLARLSRGT